MRHCGVVVAAETVRDEQHPSPGLAQHELELSLPEDRHQWLAHRPDAQRGQHNRHELEPVWQLESHRLAAPDAELEQLRRDPLGLCLQRAPGELPAAGLGDCERIRALAGVTVQIVDQHRYTDDGTRGVIPAGMPSAFM